MQLQRKNNLTGSIRKKLTLITLSLALIPLLLIGGLFSIQNFFIQARQALSIEQEASKRLALGVQEFIRGLENKIHNTIIISDILHKDIKAQTDVLVTLQSIERAFDELFLIDSLGQEIIHISRTEIFASNHLKDRKKEMVYISPMNTRKTYYSNIKINKKIGVPMITISVPIEDLRTGALGGVIVVQVRLKRIWDFISNIETNNGESLYIVDSDNRVIAHKNPTVVLRGTYFALPHKNGFGKGLNNNNVIIGFTRVVLGTKQLMVIAERNIFDALAFTIHTTGVTIIQTIIISIIIFFTLLFSIKKLVINNLTILNNVVMDFLHRNFKARALIKSGDELENLSINFNHMADMIEKYSEEMEDLVQEKTKQLHAMNQSLSDALKKMRMDLNVARKIHKRLMPRTYPNTDQINFFGYYKPVESLGGDFYDVFEISEKHIAIIIADVCGHGVGAALIATMAKIAFRNNTRFGKSLREIVDKVNNDLCLIIGERVSYLTALFCIINTETLEGSFVSAGHPKQYIIKKDSTMQSLTCNSFYIGMLKDVYFEEESFTLDPGDRLIMFTDGIIEIMNEELKMYEVKAFEELLIANKVSSMDEMVTNILLELTNFSRGQDNNDDMTMLILDIKHQEKTSKTNTKI